MCGGKCFSTFMHRLITTMTKFASPKSCSENYIIHWNYFKLSLMGYDEIELISKNCCVKHTKTAWKLQRNHYFQKLWEHFDNICLILSRAVALADRVLSFRIKVQFWPTLHASTVAAMTLLHRESKKQDTKLLPITSLNINRFSKFFQSQTHW